MPLGGLAPCPLPLGGTPLDGLTSQQHARLSADLKAVVAAAPFAVLTFYSPAPLRYIAQHGNGLSVAPTITVLGPGDVRVTWEPSYLDEYDVPQATNIQHAQATAQILGIFNPVVVSVVVENPRQVRVYSYEVTAAPVDRLITLVVW